MPTELEKHLSRLEAPAPPQNLKNRCLNTIPVAVAGQAASQKAAFRKPSRPFKLQRVALSGALMFSVVAAVAFWSTRPAIDGKARPSGSIAFAQVIEAARRVTFFHVKESNVFLRDGQTKPKASEWIRSESWYDSTKGLYNRYLQDIFQSSKADSSRLPKGSSLYTQTLELPDDTSYRREGTMATVDVEVAHGSWKLYQNTVSKMLTGHIEEALDLSGRKAGKILSSSAGNWKGKKAQVFVFERPPEGATKLGGPPRIYPVRMHFYINPETKLMIAEQDFAIFKGIAPVLIAQSEFDYARPKAAIFDAKIIKEGATLRAFDAEKIRRYLKSRGKSGGKPKS